MSSRKRKNPHNNSDLPAAKRQKSDKRVKSDDNKNVNELNKFPFEKGKACGKIVPLKSKWQLLKLKNREQSIRIKTKQKEIEMLHYQINNFSDCYEYYHQLLLNFSNTFDQIFITLQQKINTNHSIPLCLVILFSPHFL